jgi:hypothetical protein
MASKSPYTTHSSARSCPAVTRCGSRLANALRFAVVAHEVVSVLSAHLKREDTLGLTDFQVGLTVSISLFGTHEVQLRTHVLGQTARLRGGPTTISNRLWRPEQEPYWVRWCLDTCAIGMDGRNCTSPPPCTRASSFEFLHLHLHLSIGFRVRYGHSSLLRSIYSVATGLSAFCWEFYGFAAMRFITGAGLGAAHPSQLNAFSRCAYLTDASVFARRGVQRHEFGNRRTHPGQGAWQSGPRRQWFLLVRCVSSSHARASAR